MTKYAIMIQGHHVKDERLLPRVFDTVAEAEIYCIEHQLPAYAEVVPYDQRGEG